MVKSETNPFLNSVYGGQMSIEKPEISIIVPVYNGELYLSKCLDSVINQSFKDWELIIADDGSDDQTPVIADRYSESDARIQVMHLNRAGVSVARNTSIETAKGNYIAFVDSDDLLEPDFLSQMIGQARSGNADIVQCSFSYIDEKDVRTEGDAGTDASFEGHDEILNAYSNGPLGDIRVSVWAKLFSRDFFSGVRFRNDIKIYEDAFYVYECCKKARKVSCFKTPLYLYRQHGFSVMHTRLSECYSDYFSVFDMQREELKGSNDIYRKITKREIETALWLIRILRCEGKNRECWLLRKKLTGLGVKDLFSGTPFKVKLKLTGVIVLPHLYFAVLKVRKK